MSASPSELDDFKELVESAIGSRGSDGLLDVVDSFAQLVHRTSVVAQICALHLEGIAADPKRDSALWGDRTILMASGTSWELRLMINARTSDYIYTLPNHVLIGVIGRNALHVDRYRAPEISDMTLFSPGHQLHLVGREEHSPGTVLRCLRGGDIYDPQVTEPVWSVKLATSPECSVQWAFDRGTKRSCRAIAANGVDSELVLLTRALAALQTRGAAEHLPALASHPAHFVRWAAIQALAKCAPELAVEQLHRATGDMHPQIRSSARKALDSIDAGSTTP